MGEPLVVPAADVMAAKPRREALLLEESGLDADHRPVATVTLGDVAITVDTQQLWAAVGQLMADGARRSRAAALSPAPVDFAAQAAESDVVDGIQFGSRKPGA